MTAYTRHDLGNKLFLIEWNLVVAGGVAAQGDFFENTGAEPVSIIAVSDAGVDAALKFTNLPTEDIVMNISGQVFIPVAGGFEPPYTPVPVLPPIAWKYGCQASGGNGVARVGIVFREV